jgi:hypothetical protein
MNVRATITRLLLAAGAAWLAAGTFGVRAQQNGHATDFTATEYYEAPHQQQIKSILSGAEAVAKPGRSRVLVIKQLRLQTFAPDGTPGLVVTAPECLYDEKAGTASSAGPLQAQNADGSFRVAGEGFLWRQINSSLTISNQVRTVIENGAKINVKP